MAAALLVAQFVSSAVAAQTAGHGAIGLGVGVGAGGQIRVPIQAGSRWRLEPLVGLNHTTTTFSVIGPGTSGESQDFSQTNWSLSLLIARMIRVDSTFTLYVGPRLGLLRSAASQETGSGSNRMKVAQRRVDKLVGLATGAEAALGRHVSLGGEVALDTYFEGHPSIRLTPSTATGVASYSGDGQLLNTSATVVLRWYFGNGTKGR